MTTTPARASLDDVSDLPRLLPTPADLDDVELALAGGVGVAGVAVGASTPGAQHQIGDAVVLTDPETTPLARLDIDVAMAYGAIDVLHFVEVPGAVPVDEFAAALEEGSPLPRLGPLVEDELRRGHRRVDQRGLTILFSGLSGSGKSTVARAVAEAVDERYGRPVTLLDGDAVRTMLSAGLTYSKADRELNIRRIGYVAAEIGRHGGLAICCPIAPYAATRAEVRAMVTGAGADFVLVHISTPLAECERRDRKGLYAKARAGLIPEFTGISDPYEEPVDADLAIDTTDVPVDQAVERVLALLVGRGALVADRPRPDLTNE